MEVLEENKESISSGWREERGTHVHHASFPRFETGCSFCSFGCGFELDVEDGSFGTIKKDRLGEGKKVELVGWEGERRGERERMEGKEGCELVAFYCSTLLSSLARRTRKEGGDLPALGLSGFWKSTRKEGKRSARSIRDEMDRKEGEGRRRRR